MTIRFLAVVLTLFLGYALYTLHTFTHLSLFRTAQSIRTIVGKQKETEEEPDLIKDTQAQKRFELYPRAFQNTHYKGS